MRRPFHSRMLAFVLGSFGCLVPMWAQDSHDEPPAQNEPAAQNDSPAPQPAAASGQSERELPNPFRDYRDRIWYPGDTERIRPLGSKLMMNILLDQKEIWTSPFHMHKQDAPWWIGLGGATAALIATDNKSMGALNPSSVQTRWGNNISQIGASYTVLPLIAGFYGYGVLRNDAQARETGILGTEAVLDSLIVAAILKPVAGRVRPDATANDRGHFFHGGDSFPSGHTIESWAVASVIAHEYKRGGGRWVPYVAYGLASAVSAARFSAQRHYLSDIAAGAGMGWFIGRYVYQTHQDHASHHHSGPPLSIVPEFDPLTRSYAVALLLTP